MSNLKVSVSKKGMLIGLIVLVLVLGGGGGYLLWRVNQKDTVAPTDSSASSSCRCVRNCEAGTAHCQNEWSGTETCVGCGSVGGVEYYCPIADFVCDYTLKYIAGTGGKIEGTATQTVQKGKSGTQVTAKPNAGYKFVKWSDGGTSASRTETNVQADATYTATFEADNTPPATGTCKFTYKAGTGGGIKPEWQGNTPHTVKYGERGPAVEAKAVDGYIFDKWSDGGTTTKRSDKCENTNPSTPVEKTFTATFKQSGDPTTRGICKFTYKAGTGGSITPDWRQDVPQEVNHATRGPAVEATPVDGYVFDKWSDGGTTTKRSDVCANTNPSTPVEKTFTATFKQSGDPTTRGICKFIYTAGTGGGILPAWRQDVPQEVNHATRGPAVEAKADDGYAFVKWEDDRPTAKRSDVCANTNPSTPVTVTFKAIFGQVDVPLTCGDGICSEGEDPFNCPQDCPSVCGDGICTGDEDSQNCPVDCGAPPAGKVPDTAIFDDTKDTIIFGIVILLVGMAWTWISTLPKKAYTKISKASSEYITEAKLTRERNTRESRRSRLERRIK